MYKGIYDLLLTRNEIESCMFFLCAYNSSSINKIKYQHILVPCDQKCKIEVTKNNTKLCVQLSTWIHWNSL